MGHSPHPSTTDTNRLLPISPDYGGLLDRPTGVNNLAPMSRFTRIPGLVLLSAALTALPSLLGADKPAGLSVAFTGGNATDHMVWPGVQLHVSPGETASPFLPPGAFSATWSGFVNSELRAEYTFHVEAAGEVVVEVNGTAVITGKADAATPQSSPSVKLNKGANPIKVTYKSPATGEAFIRLYWSNGETPRNPIPLTALSHDESDALKSAKSVHLGRDTFAEARCVRCHDTGAGSRMPELAMDAPAFNGIGARRSFGWMAKWIADPQSMRPGTAMPKVFHGPDAAANAEAVAAYLASLGGTVPEAKAGDAEAGKGLYEKLLCSACHNPPDGTENDAAKVSQKQVKAKFKPGALAAFLQKPSEHFAWIRMPDFRLSADEASNLSAFLLAHADAAEDKAAPDDAALKDKGRKLVETTGCLNCHALDGAKSSLAAKPLGELGADRWNAGCLADAPAAGSKAPAYTFTAAQKDGLRALAKSDRESLRRHSSAEFLTRQSEALHCAECHGKHEGFPAWELLGGKLKTDWAAAFISGRDTRKPRPWLEARMPAFPAYAQHLAEGLSTRHGQPVKVAADTKSVAEDAEKGRKLTSANGGFSCISCHGVADFGATAVFEAPGINLALSFERLQPEYFKRWIRSPLSVDPTTKMPVYFDEQGKSPLPEYYEGDGPKTIQAIWEYLKLGKEMPKPE